MRMPATPPPIEPVLAEEADLPQLLASGLASQPDDQYLHWDQLRYKPVPGGKHTHRQWWLALKLARAATLSALPFEDMSGGPFHYSVPPLVLKRLHLVDRDASGRIEVPELVANPHTRDRFLVRSLIEEAITSSQLEGAATTRRDAKEMLRAGRRPRDRSEQMILNNYHAMQFIREHYGSPLTEALILELHSIITGQTLDDAHAVGRWRTSADSVSVVDQRDETVLHVPPPADQLPARIERLCGFANTDEHQPFIHPVLKSILVHFMVGYDHPFVDGNGRMARALFYWSMARHGYWLMEFTSISTILRNAPSQYARSCLHSETDANDTTYFIVYQLEVILRAIKSLHGYLARKTREIREADDWLRASPKLRALLNHRQVALIQHALKHPYESYTVQSHRRSHAITYETARTDLLDLADHGILEKSKRGRAYHFLVPHDLRERLLAMGDDGTADA